MATHMRHYFIDGTYADIEYVKEPTCRHFSFEPLHFGEEGMRCTECGEKFSVDDATKIYERNISKQWPTT